MTILEQSEVIGDFAEFGIRAFATSRDAGTFGVNGGEPVSEVMGRWNQLRQELAPSSAGIAGTAGTAGTAGGVRLASASQVHGNRVVVHHRGWEGWLRGDAADGHVSIERGTALAVSVADCVPVFVAHPSGAIALLHSGWRGTVARIIERGIEALIHRGLPASELRVHTGVAICGECYEVSPDVYGQLTGKVVDKPATVDLRAIIADHARGMGVRHITSSPSCTRCDNARFFSHRAGDSGRQLGVMFADE
ncbi:MAG TPA: polyphenol oxidase family protein [Gemmatimonadaceae bacterium]|nr:polyphenol oxidase family protein [Gemmatimonadaceae bacterium]